MSREVERSTSLYRKAATSFWMGPLFTVGFTILVLISGCNGKKKPEQPQGKLPRTNASHDTEIQDWMARLKADSALPYQIDALKQNQAPNKEGFAGSVDDLFSDSAIKILLKDQAEFFPAGRIDLASISLDRLETQLNHYQSKLEKSRASLNRPFDPFVWKNTGGLLAKSGYVDRSQGLGGLEIMDAVRAIKSGQLEEAIQALSYCGRIIRHLTSDNRLISRLTAVHLRNLWLQVAAQTVKHPRSSYRQVERIYQLLRLQMSQWPKEKDVWIADRALGLHTYELVREGLYSSLLSNDEFNELKNEGLEVIRVESVQKNVDMDEVYYLNTFEQLLRQMDKPYYQRVDWLRKLEAKHDQLKKKTEFPRVALELLLPDIKNAQYRIAKDRARCEAWMLALGTVLRKDLKQYQTSPSSGAKYSVSQLQGSVNVSGLTNSEFPVPVSCPVRLQ